MTAAAAAAGLTGWWEGGPQKFRVKMTPGSQSPKRGTDMHGDEDLRFFENEGGVLGCSLLVEDDVAGIFFKKNGEEIGRSGGCGKEERAKARICTL